MLWISTKKYLKKVTVQSMALQSDVSTRIARCIECGIKVNNDAFMLRRAFFWLLRPCTVCKKKKSMSICLCEHNATEVASCSQNDEHS